ncbi:hypothetical protein B0A52_09385 [Exophiala mesophila]|uniref:Uncharacterized protein n=1 Tax=Exophiala mesophila TaxID=212818 RepID=A0A438MSI0_EXOME|nr:hypothetical protein B0A52_09385 [Exophiala mesophila]
MLTFSREALTNLVASARREFLRKDWASPQSSPVWFPDFEDETGYECHHVPPEKEEVSDEDNENEDVVLDDIRFDESASQLGLMSYEYDTPTPTRSASRFGSLLSPLLIRRKSSIMDFDYPSPSPRPRNFHSTNMDFGQPFIPLKSALTMSMSFDMVRPKSQSSEEKAEIRAGKSEIMFDNFALNQDQDQLPVVLPKIHRPGENDFMTGALDPGNGDEEIVMLPLFVDHAVQPGKTLQDIARRMPYKTYSRRALEQWIATDDSSCWNELPELTYYTTSLGLQIAATELQKIQAMRASCVTDADRMMALKMVGGTSTLERDQGKTVFPEDMTPLLPKTHPSYIEWYWDSLKQQGNIWRELGSFQELADGFNYWSRRGISSREPS